MTADVLREGQWTERDAWRKRQAWETFVRLLAEGSALPRVMSTVRNVYGDSAQAHVERQVRELGLRIRAMGVVCAYRANWLKSVPENRNRAAVTGTLVSPPLFESLELLGRDRTLGRIRAAAGL